MRVAAVVLGILLLFAVSATADEPFPSITVTGSATVSARPDTAEVVTGVVTQAKTAAQALAQNTAAMTQVMKALAGVGIPEKDIQTSGIHVMPQRAQPQPNRPSAPDIIGYEVANQVRVRVRDLDLLGRLLDTLVSQGANTVTGVSLSIADPAPLLQGGRAKAIGDARQKAEVYAAAANVKLGRVLFIRDGTPAVPRGVTMLMRQASAAVPVAAGEQEMEVSVSVTYALE